MTRTTIRSTVFGRRRTICGPLLLALLVSVLRPAPASALTTPALLDTIQHTAFNYFWIEANPANGLIKDRSTTGSPASIAAVGFGLSAICIGIDHGWVSRVDGRQRVLTTLNTFWTGPQGSGVNGFMGYKGLFYHFLDMSVGVRTWDSELSSIDTALLLAGAIDAKQYFNTADALDIQVRALVDSIYRRVDWEFMRASGVGIRMGWKPVTGFNGFGTWTGYNEAMIMYLLGLGSPTKPPNPNNPGFMWSSWTAGYDWLTYYGYTYIHFPPLFGHQYSHCWIDYRYIQDNYTRNKGITYFENSRRATLAQWQYCIANPGGFTGYGPTLWGLTAGDGPNGYAARGAPPAENDNGTIAPTAAISSLPFTPDEVIPTMHNFFDNYPLLWGPYGFKDGFNLTSNPDWYGPDVIGIDQGPIIIMIENYLNQKVWLRFMQNVDVQRGLTRAGFTAVAAVDELVPPISPFQLSQNSPNPFRHSSRISYRLDEAGLVSLTLFDVMGRTVRTLVNGLQTSGIHDVTLDGQGLPSGIYWYRLNAAGRTETRQALLVR
ncbi:MAG: glucoamylase family protein [Candidatus Eisenbacteria bacterium]|nr:glucoamylase family protein [Candidatus Eisenbacteria bacterium]